MPYIRPEFFLLKYFVKQIGKKLVLSIFGSDISVGSRFKSFLKGYFLLLIRFIVKTLKYMKNFLTSIFLMSIES